MSQVSVRAEHGKRYLSAGTPTEMRANNARGRSSIARLASGRLYSRHRGLAFRGKTTPDRKKPAAQELTLRPTSAF